METTKNPIVSVFGINFDLTILATALVTVALVFGFIFWSSRKMTIKPKGKQNVLEAIYEFVNNTVSQNLGNYTSNYSLLMLVFFTFIFTANNLGLVVTIRGGEYNFWTSPTSNFGVTLTLSLITAVVCHVEGIRKKGIKEYFKAYLQPYPGMLPLNLLEQVTNIISLSLRLFGNIFSGEALTGLILQLAAWSLLASPIAFLFNLVWVGFSAFIGFIQAYVFILLSSTYIGDKVE